jgi:hypothetical protein
MTLLEHGRIQGGAIVLSKPLPLPEGTEVSVRIEPVSARDTPAVPQEQDQVSSTPFFGMWADREDMADSTVWVRRERERWRDRVEPRG